MEANNITLSLTFGFAVGFAINPNAGHWMLAEEKLAKVSPSKFRCVNFSLRGLHE